jgi:hypothetical protein
MTIDPWPIIWPEGGEPAGNDEQVGAAISAATTLLWTRTGRRLGLRTVTEGYTLPMHGPCELIPYLDDGGSWRQGYAGGCYGIHLVRLPVHSITSVSIDGAVLDPAAYRYDGVALERIDACWPVQNDADDAPRIEVTYRWGVSLDEASPLYGLAALAMGEVTAEVLNALNGRACKLPSRAVTITRAGVTVQLGDAQEIAKEGLLGLPLADQLILAVNPGRRRQRSRVYSPDMARRARVAAP